MMKNQSSLERTEIMPGVRYPAGDHERSGSGIVVGQRLRGKTKKEIEIIDSM